MRNRSMAALAAALLVAACGEDPTTPAPAELRGVVQYGGAQDPRASFRPCGAVQALPLVVPEIGGLSRHLYHHHSRDGQIQPATVYAELRGARIVDDQVRGPAVAVIADVVPASCGGDQ